MELTKAIKDGYRSMNPCPVFEKSAGKLFLFFICAQGQIKEYRLKAGQTRLCYISCNQPPIRDEDWSQLTDLTDDDAVGKHLNDDQTFAVGPGHGIQLESGRLVIPTYIKKFKDSETWLFAMFPLWYFWTMKSYAFTLYSDDRGATWQVGEKMPAESGEFQVAEVSDRKGRRQLYCNARNSKAIRLTYNNQRVEAVSEDGGASFSLLSDLTLQERPNGCQGSVLSFPSRELQSGGGGESAAPETALLFSHPTAGEGWDRLELGVYLRESLQDQHPWGKPHIVHPGRSGYSDLTRCEEEGRFACLMECSDSEHHSSSLGNRRKITFQEFQLN